MMVSCNRNNTFLQVRYEVRAQFIPTSSEDWAKEPTDKTLGISKLRASGFFYLNHDPLRDFPAVQIEREIKTDFIGFSKQFCNTKIYLKQQEFFQGEKIPIHLVCHN
jgi:hypothetical protein